MRAFVLALATAATVAVVALAEHEAAACGGCFVAPETPTVVNDHRMILTIAKDQSTLYDQIRYSGSPASFAWVLPIAGTVDIGISADSVFAALDGQTRTQIFPPPRNCPGGPKGCGGTADASAGGPRAGGGAEGGVDVLRREVVGPYETVQLAATDPNALSDWLTQNGYAIAPDVQPVIGAYVTEKFNFLALKLVPGKGVQDMRPVRVTTTGAGAVLPLRMVAAGTGPVVGISLWVVAEGRYEPQNFPTFHLGTNEIAWDWTQSRSNYTELRAQKTAEGSGRAWEIESSIEVAAINFTSSIVDADYLPEEDAQGTITKSAAEVRAEDLTTLLAGIGRPRVTRMRSDLAHAALDQDMAMFASQDQGVLSNVRQLTRELNEPLCPVWNGCTSDGQASRSEAVARSANNWGAGDLESESGEGGTFSCAASQAGAPPWMAAGLGFFGLALVRAARRRRR